MEIEEIFARRLRSARIMLGWSMDMLCEKMGNLISKQSISKYENGKMMPDSTVLIAMANALGVDPDYFFRPFLFNMDEFKVSFRKKSKVQVYETNAIKEKIRDKVERYLEIENILGVKNEFRFNAYTNAILSSPQDIKAQALRVRDDWGLGLDAINNVQAILEQHSIKVIDVEAPDGFDGLSGVVNNKYPIIVLNANIHQSERRRMTALHELGHLLFNKCFDPVLTRKQREDLCTIFANEMLIPSTNFIQAIGENRRDISLNELIDLQVLYGVSVDAMMMKAKELNIITESRCRSYYIKKNANPNFKALVEMPRYEEKKPERFLTLVFKAVASDIISTSKAATLLNSSIDDVRNRINLV
jgi:Zn-dependent peptidase ImmA (M78 family)/DNA-binding XRE family transcriptional regulator